MAPAAAPTPRPINAPLPAPYPVPAPTAAPAPVPTTAPVAVPQPAAARLSNESPSTLEISVCEIIHDLLGWSGVEFLISFLLSSLDPSGRPRISMGERV